MKLQRRFLQKVFLIACLSETALAIHRVPTTPPAIYVSCNTILRRSPQSPTATFMTMFADHRPVFVDGHKVALENFRAEIHHYLKLSGRFGELAFLVRKTGSETTGNPYEVLIGHPSESLGRHAPNMALTHSDGSVAIVSIANIFAYTLLDTRNRDALFDREFPAAYEGADSNWNDNSYIQKIYYLARNEPPGEPIVQKAIDEYRARLDYLERCKAQLALLIREPRFEKQELVIGTVKPIVGPVNGYNAIMALEIQTPASGKSASGKHFVPIALNSYSVGVIKMTNEDYARLTPKRAAHLKVQFDRLPLPTDQK